MKAMHSKAPFYIYVPTARPLIQGTLLRWFAHAMQAKASPNQWHKFKQELAKQLAQTQGPQRRNLEKLDAWSPAENPDRKKFTQPLHFVITDVSQFVPGMKMSKTSQVTPDLVKLLNKFGPRTGIFFHYLAAQPTLAEMGIRTPPREHAVVHLDRQGRWRISPGGASNLSLQFIAGHSRKGRPAIVMRIDDDIAPRILKSGKRGSDNVFEQLRAALNHETSAEGSYTGYVFGSESPHIDREPTVFATNHVFSIRPEHLRTMATRYGEFHPNDAGMRRLSGLPDGLLHGGSTSLSPVTDFDVFGSHPGGEHTRPLSKKTIARIERESGLRKKR